MRPHWAAEVRAILEADPTWSDWDFYINTYDDRNNLHVQPLFVRVLNKRGPVILVENVQRKPLEELRGRLRTHAIVITEVVGDSTDLLAVAVEARRRFV